MAIKFEKLQAGVTYYDRHRERAGNTTMTRLGEWSVKVLEIDSVRAKALASWNGNRPEWRSERWLAKLYSWSMYDSTECETERSAMLGDVVRIRRLPKAEREKRKAERRLNERRAAEADY